MENLPASTVEQNARFQSYVVYAILSEVLEMAGLRRWIGDGDGEGFFFLRYVYPLFYRQLANWTGCTGRD